MFKTLLEMLITSCYSPVDEDLFFSAEPVENRLSMEKSRKLRQKMGGRKRKFSEIFVQNNDLTALPKKSAKNGEKLITKSNIVSRDL